MPSQGRTEPLKGNYMLVREEFLDFRNFVTMAFEHLNYDDPTPRQYEIAEFMQYGPATQQIQAQRGIGKSVLAELFSAWAFTMAYAGGSAPEYSVLAASAAGQRAYNFSTFVLNLIKGWDEIKFLAPLPDGRTSKISFDVGPAPVQDSPSMRSMGITSAIAGSRANCIILDDVEAFSNSATQVQREKLIEQTREVAAVIRPLPPDESLERMFPHLPLEIIKQIMWRIIVLGTPQTEDTIYNAFTERGYQKRIWPARYPGDRWMKVNGIYLSPAIAAEMALEPELCNGGGYDGKQGQPADLRFGEFDLQQRELQYGRSGFALQFMLDTSLADQDRYPLKINDLIVFDVDRDKAPQKLVWTNDPEYALRDIPCLGFNGDRFHRPMMVSEGKDWHTYQGTVMAIDPAGRGKDETSIAIVSILNSFLFVHRVKGYGPSKGYEEDVLEDIALMAREYKVRKVVVEKNFGDGMFQQLLMPHLRRIHPCSIEEVHHSIQKERRIIDTLEPVLNSHRLVMSREAILEDQRSVGGLSEGDKIRYQLIYQLSRLTRERGALLQDDRLDALAMAVSYWVESMALDADIEIKARRSEALDRELRTHMQLNYGIGRPGGGQTWMGASGVIPPPMST